MAEKKEETTERRRRGRPQAGQARTVTRTSILRAALRLSRTTPLQDISIVAVAKALNVTPPLIHYYVGGRDWLTSGVMNLFYRDVLKRWPRDTAIWHHDLLAAARLLFERFTLHGGIAAYCVANSRFRIFQQTAFGDRDYGVEVLDRFTGLVRRSALSDERIGIYANQLMEFVISTGNGASHHLFPSEHRAFLEHKVAELDAERHSNILFARHAPLMLDAERVFVEGTRLIMLGMATDLSGRTLDSVIADAFGGPLVYPPSSSAAGARATQ